MYLQHDSTVRLHLTTSGRRAQTIPHPRPVSDIIWRHPGTQLGNRNDDPILYTTTTDGTLRVFLSVLDAPQRVQLHAALDAASSIPLSSQPNSPEEGCRPLSSSVFPLDREAVQSMLKSAEGTRGAEEDARTRRVREIAEEGWDLFLRVLADGSLVVQAVAVCTHPHSILCDTKAHRTLQNIDRRPPTLLKQFTLLQSPPSLLSSPPPLHLYVVPAPSDSATLTLITSPPLASYALTPLPFFDARADGLNLLVRGADQQPHDGGGDGSGDARQEIVRFVRTPEGRGVGAVYADGSGRVWSLKHNGRRLEERKQWKASDTTGKVDRLVVLDGG